MVKKKKKKNKKKYVYPPRQRVLIDKTVCDAFSRKVCALGLTEHPTRMSALVEKLMIKYIFGDYDKYLLKKRYIKRQNRVKNIDIVNVFVNRDLGVFFANAALNCSHIRHKERASGFIEYRE